MHILKTTNLRQWRKEVYERDKGLPCPMCNEEITTVNSQAHHIKRQNDSPEYSLYVSNGIMLCCTCHYSIKDREYLHERSFRSILRERHGQDYQMGIHIHKCPIANTKQITKS